MRGVFRIRYSITKGLAMSVLVFAVLAGSIQLPLTLRYVKADTGFLNSKIASLTLKKDGTELVEHQTVSNEDATSIRYDFNSFTANDDPTLAYTEPIDADGFFLTAYTLPFSKYINVSGVGLTYPYTWTITDGNKNN